MCGIAGVVALGGDPPTEELIRRQCDAILHRGPDDEGILVRGAVGLGMRRLSIIDLAGGNQPIHNEDGSIAVVYNGEIYNFQELRDRLQAAGHTFRTACDTEVIVHLWEEHGEDFVRHLNGMFALALHDERTNRFVLARDRLGIKPLYVYADERALVYGSEVKALLASDLVPRQLDIDALGEFLAWEYVPAPRTLLQGVRKLEPGAMLIADLATREIRERVWWDLPGADGEAGAGGTGDLAAATPSSAEEWEDAIDAKIRECVRRQLIADVPLGAFLSGGVDSSLVVAAMGEARTFSIGFDDPSYNELDWSRQVADHLGVSHRTEVIRPDVGELFARLMNHMDDPIGDFSIFPTYLVSRLAREEVTVALSGDGGDEIFGGYETYVAQERARLWRRIPAFLRAGIIEPVARRLRPTARKKGLVNKVKRFVEGFDHDERLGHARWRAFMTDALRAELFSDDAAGALRTPVADHAVALGERAGAREEVDRGLYVDMKSYLSDNCLVKTDRMSMACSLEARVPLLDHELVELAFSMPAGLKVRGGQTKPLLKRVALRHVPRECVLRPKEGFSIPIKNWLRREFEPLMRDLLAPDRIAAEGLFRPPVVRRLQEEHLAGTANHSHILWSLLVFQDWRRRWSV